jgi:hypothetical protein
VEHPEDFASGFERAFARLQIEVETACARQADWPSQVAVGIRAALDFAAAQPAAARALTTDALAAGYERYDRMLTYFGERLLPGRELSPEGEQLPEIVERALTGGLSMLVAQRLEKGNEAELPGAAEEAIQFVLAPYVGAEEAGRLATLHGR